MTSPTQGEHAPEALRPEMLDDLIETFATAGLGRHNLMRVELPRHQWAQLAVALSRLHTQVAAITAGNREELAHELFAAAQLAPGEGIEDAVSRITAALTAAQEVPKCEFLAHGCDTPSYCQSVQRCTARDKTRAATAQPAAPQGVAYAEPDFKMGRGYIERSIGGVAYREGWVDALEALRASNGQAPAGATPLEEIQWRNIKKVVRALADHCFGDKNDPRWGVAHISIVNSLTAKDGIDILALGLERLTPTAQAAPAAERQYINGVKTVADLVNNLLLLDQSLPIYAAQHIQIANRRRTITVPPTVSLERVKDERWIGEGDELNAAVIWTRADAPAVGAVAGPVETIKFSDDSTADPVEKARRYLNAMADHRINSQYFFDDGWPKKESAIDAMATLAVLEQLAAAPTPAAQADSVLELERICAAIKAEDDYCVEHGDYMLDSDDCIKIVRGEWVRPDFSVAAARKQGGTHD
ncbi:MAG: hypothetical protein WAP57_11775 [Aquabacterium commune]|uniref:hypothetical protein n=1 Tax=Aquabacterium commune TaxID=70586 RepID=UPI003BAE9CDA